MNIFFRWKLYSPDAGDGGGGTDDSQDNSRNHSGSGSGSDKIDYEAKYKGANKTISRMQNEMTLLQTKYDNTIADYERQIASLNSEKSIALREKDELATQVNGFKTQIEALSKDKTKLEGQTKAQNAVLGLLDEHPGLANLQAQGLLADASSFESDEAYTEYLKKMGGAMGDPNADKRRKKAEGAVGASGGSGKTDGDDKLTEEEILDWLYAHEASDDPKKYTRYQQLLLTF